MNVFLYAGLCIESAGVKKQSSNSISLPARRKKKVVCMKGRNIYIVWGRWLIGQAYELSSFAPTLQAHPSEIFSQSQPSAQVGQHVPSL